MEEKENQRKKFKKIRLQERGNGREWENERRKKCKKNSQMKEKNNGKHKIVEEMEEN